MRLTRRIVIHKPSDEIFAFLTQPESHPRFVPGLIEFRLVSNEMGADARLTGIRRDFGLRQRLEYRVSTFEAPRTFALTGRAGPLEGTATYRLSPLGPDQTELVFEIEGRIRGPLRVADRLLGPLLRRAADETPANLERVVEASGRDI
jgi:carbon monoxide dehydrogenase subunit G